MRELTRGRPAHSLAASSSIAAGARVGPGFIAGIASLLFLMVATSCAPATGQGAGSGPGASPTAGRSGSDPRVGLAAGLTTSGEAVWNMRVLSETPPPERFVGSTNSDLAFIGNYAIQGNYNGFQVWDIANPARPAVVTAHVCPASQSDVSVYRNLLFVSGEGLGGRLDCGTQGVQGAVSPERLRGIRIFDISDIRNPRYVANVQTCRGSHTHSLLVDPDDSQNVYVYISGSSSVRPPAELPGCVNAPPEEDPASALFRIEVIRVPLARPQDAAIVSSPRIFTGLVAPPEHGPAPEDMAEIDAARRRGAFVADIEGQPYVLSNTEANSLLAEVVQARGGAGAATAADSAQLRTELPRIVERMLAARGPLPGPTQCHDITLYPAINLAGGACEGYGMLIDISDPVNPQRLDAAADPNFSYWHSATFNNDGSKMLFSDEWGGGVEAKCRATDPTEWGADAIFSVEQRRMRFRSYYKLPAAQTALENCVAHNGSMIPIPGRDVMVQAWYQGGISVFDWTDADKPFEIAFFDRGPVSATRLESGGSWSAYWYNGLIVSSEIARGLDILELTPSEHLTQNEINAAKTVRFDHFNPQGQQRFTWPASFALARAYLDQLERGAGYDRGAIATARAELDAAEKLDGIARHDALRAMHARIAGQVARANDAARVGLLAETVATLSTVAGDRPLAVVAPADRAR